MGVIARFLGWLWRRWADYNSVVSLLDLFDWKTGVWALFAAAGMMLFGSTNTAWSPQAVLLAVLAAAACVSVIVIAVRLVWKKDAATPSTGRSASGGIADWPIHELFSYIDPQLLERVDNGVSNRWDEIGNDIRDQAALGHLNIYGRPVMDGVDAILGQRPTLRLIDAHYWTIAFFTFSFFDDTAGDAPHTYLEYGHSGVEYTDLRVNRDEALTIWRR